MPKHFFFDLDNTLTPSKSLIEEAHVPILAKLCERADVVVASGHGEDDIRKHLRPALAGKYYVMGQNGNRTVAKDGTVLWNHSLSPEQKKAALKFISKARAHLGYKVKDKNDIVEDRDSQIAFSLIGHHEDKKVKDAFDPDFAKRRALFIEMASEIDDLKMANVEARIAGTTNIDLFPLGKNKGYNIGIFIEKMRWRKDECLYTGDALFPGGNDDTVVGVIPTKAVKNYHETYTYLEGILSS